MSDAVGRPEIPYRDEIHAPSDRSIAAAHGRITTLTTDGVEAYPTHEAAAANG